MSAANTSVKEDGFGFIPQCREIVRRYTMTNKGNSSVRLISWGAGIQSIRVPNDKGIIGDVVLGYDSIDGYWKNSHSEKITGRITNQILPTDHEKDLDFENVNWESCVLDNQVVMSNVSHKTLAGCSGATLTQVRFTWTDENELHINIRVSSTVPIPSNVTTRCLFNLAGHGTGPKELRNHVVTINASEWVFLDLGGKIPTGAVKPVDSTIYDLRFPTRLTSQRLRRVPGGGYDHNLCIDSPSCSCYRFQARILHPGSGRFMEVYSNQPGLRFYTGNDLPDPGRPRLRGSDRDCCFGNCGDGLGNVGGLFDNENKRRQLETPGKDGVLYRRHGGFSLTPQNYPNSINTEGFPTCILYPGKIYVHDMTYKFGVLHK